MIKKILKVDLIEFQKHSKLSLEFKDGVNILGGASRRGKSCIRRAIEWVCFDAKIDKVRKEGSKQTSVKITFDNDVILEKVRSASVNRYILMVKGTERTFDSIGRNMPEEIQEAIGLSTINIEKDSINLNIAQQISMPFLLDKSGAFRMKLFNQLTGNDLQDKLLVSFNKSILKTKRVLEAKKEGLESKESSFAVIKVEKQRVHKFADIFAGVYENIKNTQAKVKQFRELQVDLNQENEKLQSIKQEKGQLKLADPKILEKLEKEIIKYEQSLKVKKSIDIKLKKLEEIRKSHAELKTLNPTTIQEIEIKLKRLGALKQATQQLNKAKSQSDEIRSRLAASSAVSVDLTGIDGKIKRLGQLRSARLDMTNNVEDKKKIITQLAEAIAERDGSLEQYRVLLKEAGKCPTCGSEMTEQCLEEIKL